MFVKFCEIMVRFDMFNGDNISDVYFFLTITFNLKLLKCNGVEPWGWDVWWCQEVANIPTNMQTLVETTSLIFVIGCNKEGRYEKLANHMYGFKFSPISTR